MKDHGTFVDGVAASEHLDSSGERIIISGVDISSLTVDGILNYEHNSGSPGQIVGKILFAKKIFSEKDCDTEREKYYWAKVKLPFIYIIGELFDHVNHSGAKDVAAFLEYDRSIDPEKTKMLVNFSIEGSKLDKDGCNITRCVARKVSVTIGPCNKVAGAETLDVAPVSVKKKSPKKSEITEIVNKFKKSEEDYVIEIVNEDMIKAEYNKYLSFKLKPKTTSPQRDYSKIGPAHGEHKEGAPIEPKRTFSAGKEPKKMKVGDRVEYRNKLPRTGGQIYNDPDTWRKSAVRKAITAGMGVGAPSTLTQGAALQKEKVLKSLSADSWKRFDKKEEVINIIKSLKSDFSEKEVLAVAKTYSYMLEKEQEYDLSCLLE